MQQDCINTLKELLQNQEDHLFSNKMEGRILISNLYDVDAQVRDKAKDYFFASKQAEESVAFYEETAKYAIEMKFQHKREAFENMIQNLKRAREKEGVYKETIDNANSFLAQFRSQIESLCGQLREFETQRCEAVHSAINKFVVYEMSAEMNNKYDVGNFSKLLDQYQNDSELSTIYEHLFPEKSTQQQTTEEDEECKSSPEKK